MNDAVHQLREAKREVAMAIYQLFEWELAPGRQQDVLAMEGAFLSAIQRIGGRPIGGFTTAVGDVNRLMALIAYDDFAQYGKANEAAQQDPDLLKLGQAVSGLISQVNTSILQPTPGSSLK